MGRGWKAGFLLPLFLGSIGIVLPLRSAAEPISAHPILEALARAHPGPDGVARFLAAHLSFQEDARLFGEADHWQSPEELLARGAGDCEDYALLAAALLKRQGIEAFAFSLYGRDGYAHTVCVFIEDGWYRVINQDRLEGFRARTLQELAGQIYPRWTWGAVAERAGTRGRGVRVIQHELLAAQALSRGA